MAEITTIARPYAEAVARLARDGNAWSAWSTALAQVAAVAVDPQLATLSQNPAVPASRIAEVILAVCGEKLGEEAGNFVRLMTENKRLAALPEIVRLFEEMKAAQEGRLEARITSAFPLDDAQMHALVAKLEAKFGQKVTAEQAVDPALIGGVIIQVGDEVMDASVRGRLSDMAATLKA